MARRIVELSDIYPYHLCARSNNKDWFELPLNFVFNIYCTILKKTIKAYGIQCHSFVLMANHFHMLASTPKGNMSAAMRYFMTESSRALARGSGRINHVYGARYHWTIIRSPEHYAHAYKYIFRNPIEAGIASKAEDYQWSTLNNFHPKFLHLTSPNQNGFDEYLPTDRQVLLRWLNQSEGSDYTDQVKKALRRHEFSFSQNKNTGKRESHLNKLHPKNTPGT